MADPQVERLIPQRPPFLFVDEIVSCAAGHIQARWTPQREAPFFAGHYPGNPVLPGVLISEACFQAGGALLASQSAAADLTDRVPVLTRIRDARFKRIVRPGETLTLDVTLDETLGDASYMTARAAVGGQLAVRIVFAVMLATDTHRAEAR